MTPTTMRFNIVATLADLPIPGSLPFGTVYQLKSTGEMFVVGEDVATNTAVWLPVGASNLRHDSTQTAGVPGKLLQTALGDETQTWQVVVEARMQDGSSAWWNGAFNFKCIGGVAVAAVLDSGHHLADVAPTSMAMLNISPQTDGANGVFIALGGVAPGQVVNWAVTAMVSSAVFAAIPPPIFHFYAGGLPAGPATNYPEITGLTGDAVASPGHEATAAVVGGKMGLVFDGTNPLFYLTPALAQLAGSDELSVIVTCNLPAQQVSGNGLVLFRVLGGQFANTFGLRIVNDVNPLSKSVSELNPNSDGFVVNAGYDATTVTSLGFTFKRGGAGVMDARFFVNGALVASHLDSAAGYSQGTWDPTQVYCIGALNNGAAPLTGTLFSVWGSKQILNDADMATKSAELVALP